MAKNKDKITIYIDGVREYLTKKYGEVRSEWEITLLILEDSIRRYEQIKEAINTNGIFDSSSNRKNPLITSEKDCIATIMKLTQKMGLTPWDSSKIKNETEEDEDDYIESLTS